MKIRENLAVSDNGFVFDPETGESFTVNEVGVFNTSTGWDMLGRIVLSSTKNFTSGDTFQVTYKIILA